MNNPEQSHMKQNCPNQRDCLEMLQLILDGEATPEQKETFITKHLEECMPCFKNYHLELAIRDLLKTKCTGKAAPADLITSIKNKINTVH
jgi:anti-sigma factor (TIGR02949 family)